MGVTSTLVITLHSGCVWDMVIYSVWSWRRSNMGGGRWCNELLHRVTQNPSDASDLPNIKIYLVKLMCSQAGFWMSPLGLAGPSPLSTKCHSTNIMVCLPTQLLLLLYGFKEEVEQKRKWEGEQRYPSTGFLSPPHPLLKFRDQESSGKSSSFQLPSLSLTDLTLVLLVLHLCESVL